MGEFVMPPKVHVGHYPHHDDTVNDEGRARLRKYLAHEYALHEKLRRWTWNRQLMGLTKLGLEGGPPEVRSVPPTLARARATTWAACWSGSRTRTSTSSTRRRATRASEASRRGWGSTAPSSSC